MVPGKSLSRLFCSHQESPTLTHLAPSVHCAPLLCTFSAHTCTWPTVAYAQFQGHREEQSALLAFSEHISAGMCRTSPSPAAGLPDKHMYSAKGRKDTEGLTADGIVKGKREKYCRQQEHSSKYKDNHKVVARAQDEGQGEDQSGWDFREERGTCMI